MAIKDAGWQQVVESKNSGKDKGNSKDVRSGQSCNAANLKQADDAARNAIKKEGKDK